jgi:hypothetical protein
LDADRVRQGLDRPTHGTRASRVCRAAEALPDRGVLSTPPSGRTLSGDCLPPGFARGAGSGLISRSMAAAPSAVGLESATTRGSALHLLQAIYVIGLMLQRILTDEIWFAWMQPADFRGLSPLIYATSTHTACLISTGAHASPSRPEPRLESPPPGSKTSCTISANHHMLANDSFVLIGPFRFVRCAGEQGAADMPTSVLWPRGWKGRLNREHQGREVPFSSGEVMKPGGSRSASPSFIRLIYPQNDFVRGPRADS